MEQKRQQHTPRMKRIAPGRWVVESRTRPGVGYPCTVDACGCMAGKYGRMCHHRKLVRQAEAWYATYEALVASVPVVPAPAPVPATPAATDDFHASAGYLRLSEAFGL